MTSSNVNNFPRDWPFVGGVHRSPVNSPNKVQWRGALLFSLICAWTNGWVNNRDGSDLKYGISAPWFMYQPHCHRAIFFTSNITPIHCILTYCILILFLKPVAKIRYLRSQYQIHVATMQSSITCYHHRTVWLWYRCWKKCLAMYSIILNMIKHASWLWYSPGHCQSPCILCHLI